MKNNKNIVLKISLNIVALLLLVGGILWIYLGVLSAFKEEESEVIFDYTINVDTDYTVDLKEHNYGWFDEDMEKNQYYISELVSKINVSHALDYKSSDKTPVTYTYSSELSLSSKYKQVGNDAINNDLWEKKYDEIFEEKKIGMSNSFENEVFETIDFEKFNLEIINFLNVNRLPIETYLDYNIEYKIKSEISKYPILETVKITFRIPLALSAFNIEVIKPEEIKKEIKSEEEHIIIIDQKNIIEGIIPITSGLLLVIFVNFVCCPGIKKTDFAKKRDKILSDNGSIIVELLTPLDMTPYNITMVKNFNEMIDLQEELRIPISYYEKNNRGAFWIIHRNIVYIYSIK